ncbi:MAG: TolC family outer membrane protein [Pseudomonadales bacterium]|nr:TolC family outer membrane protein [Pseudomonadales bacterium]MCP5183324.1 TolC family outer membrane protein [Pseudomonadales bacterium]
MKPFASKLAGLFALLLLPCLAQADNMVTIYDAALDNDPVLGAARAGHKARKQAVPQARSQLLPNITAGASTTWNERSFPVPPIQDTNPASPTFGQFVDVPDQNFNEHAWQARLTQPLLDMEAWYGVGSAKATVKQSASLLAATEQNLIVRVIQSYLSVLRAQDLLDSTVAEEAAVKRQLEQVQQRFDVGLVAITDVLEAQAAYDNSVARRIQADGDQGIQFETLRTLTGMSHESLDRLAASLPIIDPSPRNEEDWVNSALGSNLNIAAAEAQLRAAEKTLRARQAAHLPTLNGVINHSHFSTGGPSFIGNKIDTTSYSLELSLPLYLGGFNHARRREAGALAEQAREQLQDQRLTVSRDTRNLFRAVATDVVRVKARLKAIKSSESALDATQTGYEVGTRNIVDVLQAQQRLYGTQFEYADARYSYVNNLMRLKQAAGTLVVDDLQELNNFTDAGNPVKRQVLLSNQ